MSYLLTSDLKQRTAKVLTAALKKPQFVFRDGEVFVIRRIVLADVADSGGGDMTFRSTLQYTACARVFLNPPQ